MKPMSGLVLASALPTAHYIPLGSSITRVHCYPNLGTELLPDGVNWKCKMRYDSNDGPPGPLSYSGNCSSSPSTVGRTYRVCYPCQGINGDAHAWGWHDLKFITGPVCRGGPPDKDEYLV